MFFEFQSRYFLFLFGSFSNTDAVLNCHPTVIELF